MNFKKTWKRFMNMSRSREGFTLVELIVVIAILAILAGVGIPVYSGYIKKANEAADQQLLGVINTAFGAACLENDTNAASLPDRSVQFDIANMKVSKYDDEFQTYFAGNEGTFKEIDQLIFVNGVFADPTTNPAGVTAYTYAGATIYLTDGELAALLNSTFLNASTLGGSAGLLDQVNKVTNIAAGMADGLNAVFTDPTFKQNAMASLGITTDAEYTAKQNEMIAALMEKNPGMTTDQAIAQLSANAAVLYAANSAVNFTDEKITELFSTTGIDAIKDNLKAQNGGSTTEGMAQAALVYGMYTAYANSTQYGNSTLQDNMDNPLAVLEALEKDDDFKTYINSSQGQEDLTAYLGALNIINDSAKSDPAAVEHLMVNGFNNSELKDILANATKK